MSKESRELSWVGYSFEARQNITSELIERLAEGERLCVQRANQNTRVFDREVGGRQNLWVWAHGCLEPSLDFYEGWLQKEDGTREKVWYYFGEGWLTSDELSDLRQMYPRTAP
jgi:hypothetical protein